VLLFKLRALAHSPDGHRLTVAMLATLVMIIALLPANSAAATGQYPRSEAFVESPARQPMAAPMAVCTPGYHASWYAQSA